MTRFSTAIAINELVRIIQGRWHVVSLTYVVLIGFWTVAAPLMAIIDFTSDDAHAKVNPTSME